MSKRIQPTNGVSNKPIRVNVVLTTDGSLIGRTLSDRWNLETIHAYMTPWECNPTIDAYKHAAQTMGLALHVHKDKAIITTQPSRAEQSSLAGMLNTIVRRLNRMIAA